MEERTLVSICIPAYNAAKFIEATINCLLQQTHAQIELIVVDDHSIDDTLAVISNIKDERLRILQNPGKGAAAARNFAYRHASGDYIVFFDADDIVMPNFIATQLSALYPDVSNVVVSAWGRFTGDAVDNFQLDPFIIDQNMPFYEWIINYWTFYRHTTPPGRVMIPRKIIEQTGLWNETSSLNDDFEFFTRIFLHSSVIKYNNTGIFYYRSGVGGLSAAASAKAYQSYFKTLQLSLQKVEQAFPGDKKIALACANLWQMFIYHVYPHQTILLKKAAAEVSRLGGANIGFPAGGKTGLLLKIAGWKLTKRMKNFI